MGTKRKQLTLLSCPPERLLSPDQPTPEDPLLPEPSETDPESTWPVCRFSDLRRSTSACPTCLLSPTRISPSRLSTLSTRDGRHALSSPPRSWPIPPSSSSPDLLSTREDTGPCGSSQCSDALTHSRFSTRSRSARRNTLDAELELSDSTESDRCRWLDSSPESNLSSLLLHCLRCFDTCNEVSWWFSGCSFGVIEKRSNASCAK